MTQAPKPTPEPVALSEAILRLSKKFKHAVLFSFFTNLLVLAPTWYMLEVYDRVLNSQNRYTLLMLTVMVVGMYLLLEALTWVRGLVMLDASQHFDASLRERVFSSIFRARLRQVPGGTAQSLFDLKTIQDAIASPALMALVDTPFSVIAWILLFWMGSAFGWLAVAGAMILVTIALLNQYRVHPPLALANKHAIAGQAYVSSAIRNAQAIRAMGMLHRIHARWRDKQQEFLGLQAIASDRAGVNTSLSKFTQTLQGSLLLGLGCWFALRGVPGIDGSTMIVASILGGRALSPLVVVVTNWRVIMNAQDAARRLDKLLKAFPLPNPAMPLPPPKGELSVEGVTASAPNSPIPILKGVALKLTAGQSLGVVGPSASGKTTLARLITGIWPAMNGKVRLDGVDIYSWDKVELGPHVGYLPQNVELFNGTLAENIARFGPVDIDKVTNAANVVGLDRLVASLPDGFDTQLGVDGALLSGGQRQRVALARAIYGTPKFLVLDEPNSSLDEEGDAALIRTIQHIKSCGTTLAVVTHRSQVLSEIDLMVVLVDGGVKLFGPRDEVMQAINQGNQPVASPAGTAVAVKP